MITDNLKFTFLTYAGVSLTALLIQYSGGFSSLDNKILDGQFALQRDHFPRPVENDVIIVGIDNDSRDALKEPINLWHQHYAHFLQAMALARPRAVALDIVLPDRSYEFMLPGFDKTLRDGIVEARNVTPVIYGRTMDGDNTPRPIYGRYMAAMGGDSATGYALLPRDQDLYIRRYPSLLVEGQEATRTLAAQVARNLNIASSDGIIDYALGSPYTYTPFNEVLQWFQQGDREQLQHHFQDKIVLLGAILPFEDRHFIPVNLSDWEQTPESATRGSPGVLIHAQALRGYLNGGLLQSVPLSAMSLLILITGLLILLYRQVIAGLLLMLLAMLCVSALSTYTLSLGWHLPPTALLFVIAASYLCSVSFRFTTLIRERWRLRNSFSAYVSPPIMHEILQGRLMGELGGSRHHICVLFSDIRGFTERSESLPAEEIISLLNRYFDRMSAAIHQHDGTLDKFIGDGIMAFFGAPNRLNNPAENAFFAARQMLEELAQLNQELSAEGIPEINIGIGLHIGQAVVGHVGSHERHEYTAIGDVVNLTSRVESLTKQAGYPLLCTAEVLQQLEQRDEFLSLGTQQVKGHTPVEVFAWNEEQQEPS